MSAHLAITALMIDENRKADFQAARRAVAALEGFDVTDLEFFDHDPDEAEGLKQIRAVLRSDLRALRDAIAGYREIAEMNVRGARLCLTGGLSYGDGPTEIWDATARLRAVRGVLTAAGFRKNES
jgi:hypothetical protein